MKKITNLFPLKAKNVFYIGISAIIIALTAISIFHYFDKKTENNVKITAMENNAFGLLLMDTQENLNTSKMENESISKDNESYAQKSNDSAITQVAGKGGGGTIGMPNPYSVNYNYIYEGEEIIISDTSMAVFKKIKNNDSGQKITNIDSGNALINLNKFKNKKITNFNVVEDSEFGYSIYFNLIDNLITINQNWERWPREDSKCDSQKCLDNYQLKISDIPADDEIILIADNFIKNYDIDMKNYGKGQITNYLARFYGITENELTTYVSENIPVIYPLKINDQIVYDESGNLNGITVDVNIRYKKVTSMYGMTSQNYESSDYEIETDSDKIISVAENGGISYYNYDAEKTIDIKLGTPIRGLMAYWKYNDKNNESDELFIPAYVFPIIDAPKDTYLNKKNIVVPLVKEMLSKIKNQPIFRDVIIENIK